MTHKRHVLSKSTFIRGLQCEKSLYLYKHFYKLRDEISAQLQAIFNRGNHVGILARQLFPGGTDASPESPFKYAQSVKFTDHLLKKDEQVIYEAAFQHNGVLAAMDILVASQVDSRKSTVASFSAYEVKSSTSLSETYILDAALQYYVITGSGITLDDISIVYINNQYIRQGDLEVHKLFTIESVKERVLPLQKFIHEEVERLKKVVFLDEVPEMKIGLHCMSPYNCDFMGQCWKHVPGNSIFDIANMHMSKKFELLEDGVLRFDEIPPDAGLNEKQWRQVNCELTKDEYIDSDALRDFLATINYPLYYMDFETMTNMAIPLFNGTRPYQQIPFQFSVHYKEHKDAETLHFEFLAEAGGDPRESFVTELLKCTSQPGDILVYNKSFENRVLGELGEKFPQYSKELDDRISRVKDLMDPFRQGVYYKPEMKGSYSIKKVLPALVPEFSYDNLNIKEGGMASIAFEKLFYEDDMFKIQEVRADLLKYCELDTLAMVKILERMEQTVHG